MWGKSARQSAGQRTRQSERAKCQIVFATSSGGQETEKSPGCATLSWNATLTLISAFSENSRGIIIPTMSLFSMAQFRVSGCM